MKECIILYSGNSINDGIEQGLWSKIKGKDIWSLNSIFKLLPSDLIPTRQLWVDASFFRHESHNIQILHKKGTKLHCKRSPKYAFIGNMINQHDVCREREFYKEKMEKVSHIFIGGHGLVGVFALSLAVKEKYDTIYALGMDWGTTNVNIRKTHCFQDKMKDLNIYCTGAGNPEIYLNQNNTPNKWIKDFEIFGKEDTKIYNVSPKSNINTFEKIDYSTFFKKIGV